ncbi:ATP-binding cassette domain-containing protein [Shewanella sp. D64]|uniref:ABC transporter ATP-binding protein n=1 Tax=unclassified Shewanella TaxID=196818 RepID=UPI0022BA3D41|nr:MULTISPECIES: ABC transporter ATP-binding protein [unclassified Shewanella]MEC4724141.1 ATP-binding cassette domain-containing protein [Shewanella sp. D64]MEC4736161.1 ATP-binding cassette domain-containing protein [Shewanella sp. E94]WBJ97899.1 ATP-binding cassette domain-containing protein [Shewanella sp. MTB7]
MSIWVENLSYSYGRKQVLNELSFSLTAGFNVLLGPNGAGKSTLFSLLTGLFETGHGQIKICNFDLIEQKRSMLRLMGVVFQQSTLDLDLSVKQNLLYHASLHGISPVLALKNIKPILEQLHLSERLNDRVRQLNGGHRRRLEIARALIHQPKVILLDEPTVGLDTSSRRLIIEHVRALAHELGICILWATHLMDEVSSDDVLILLDKGQVRAQGHCNRLCDDNDTKNVLELYHKLTSNRELM